MAMNSKFKKEFIDECVKNREFLGYSYNDVASSLINVSEEEYINFEEGNFSLSSENIKRLMRLLCVKKPSSIDVNKYIDTSGLNEVEIEDLSKMVSIIVGEEND